MSALPATPVERLMLSRERMRKVLYGKSVRHADGTAKGGGPDVTDWLGMLESIPGASVIIDAVRSWWAQHPLRVAGSVAANAARAVVRPLAQRHPGKLVLGAFVMGALVAWVRPWRWVGKPALLTGLVPQLIEKAIEQVPVQSWLVVLTSLAQQDDQPEQRSNPMQDDSAQTQASPLPAC